MDWKYFLFGLGMFAFSYLIYRKAKGEKPLENINWGTDWMWVIFGPIVGLVLILKSMPTEAAIDVVLCLGLVIVFLIIRLIFTLIRRLIKRMEK